MGDGPVAPGGAVPRLLDTSPNLYGDLSAYSGSRAVMRDEVFGLAFLERYQDRLMYGSDTINSVQVMPLGGYLDSCVEDGRLSREAYEKICYQNAQKLLNIYGGQGTANKNLQQDDGPGGRGLFGPGR